jgi:hypothetical protein
MVKCLFVVNRSCIHPEDSNLASVEAKQWVLLYLSIGHDIVNISHSAAKISPSTIMHVPYCALPVVVHPLEEIFVVVACKQMWQNTRAYQTIPAHTLMLNFCWCVHSILSAITHKLNVSGHMLIWTFFLVLLCELVPKVCPYLSVTPSIECINYAV